MLARRLFLIPVCLILAMMGATAGCGNHDQQRAEAAAADLAQGLADHKLAGITWAGADPAKEYAAVTEAITHDATTVSVEKVSVDAKKATATLSWKVDLGEHTWAHTTSASLVKAGSGWKTSWSPTLIESSLKEGETIAVSRLNPDRGRILGAADAVLVEPRPVLRIGIDKTGVAPGQATAAARKLAGLVDVDPDRLVKAVAKAGPKAFVEAIVLRRADVSTTLLNRITGLAAARVISDHRPLAPSKDFAAALLGTVGPATAELIDKSGGRLHNGDITGLSGLQLRYDEKLFGTPGVKVVAVDEKGVRRSLFEAASDPGSDLDTTLEPKLEAKAQRVLADVGPASALVAIKPSTGAILAAASGPGSNGLNTATFGQYAPGSTFKVVSALALLRAGLTPDSKVQCTPRISVNGKVFKNYSDYPSSRMGDITLLQALANSCNTGFISQADRLTAGDLTGAAAALGIGVDYDLGFPAYLGQVPPAASQTEGAADMIGQGKILASPMAMATVLASVVKGSTVVPHLLAEDPPSANIKQPLTTKETGQLRTMLRAVVREGSGALLQPLGPNLLAKTGTAEYGDTPPLPTHAWMIAAKGDLAVAVFVDTGSSGSGTAGPILKAFLSR